MRRNAMRILMMTAALLAAVVGAGCASLRKGDLDVRVSALEFTRVSPLESTGLISLRLINSGRDPIRIGGAVCILNINQVPAAKGVTPETVTVPALTSGVMVLPFHMDNMAVAKNGINMMALGELEYVLESKLFVQSGWGWTSSVTVESRGKIRLAPSRASEAAAGAPPRAGN